MVSGSANNTNTTQEVVIYEPTMWDLVYAGEELNRSSAIGFNPPAWITQLFDVLQKVEEDIRLLAEAREEEDAIEIHISDMRSYYETLFKNGSELFWEITLN
jgi:hypothetical protein